MKNFVKKSITDDERILLENTSKFLETTEWNAIKDMFYELESDVNKLSKLEIKSTKRVIVGVSALNKRLKLFAKTVKELRNCYCETQK